MNLRHFKERASYLSLLIGELDGFGVFSLSISFSGTNKKQEPSLPASHMEVNQLRPLSIEEHLLSRCQAFQFHDLSINYGVYTLWIHCHLLRRYDWTLLAPT